MSLIDPKAPPAPARAPEGGHGWCPKCECGGVERPCWYCGSEGPFYASIARVTSAYIR